MDLPSVEFLHHLADLADEVTMRHYRKALEVGLKHKEGESFDPVTEADRLAEIALRQAIGHNCPTHAVVGEEFGCTGSGDARWVLDPVDGTRPFLCGIPVWTTLIGYCWQGVARRGMVSQPYVGERFWNDEQGAWGAYRGRVQRLRTSGVSALSEAILHTTSPDHHDEALQHRFARLRASSKMTRYGGESYAKAMLAAGQIDVCWEPSLQPYDIVALIPIIEGAGGVVTSLSGGRAEEGGAVLMTANPRLHELALDALR